jgi:hypothetical protein
VVLNEYLARMDCYKQDSGQHKQENKAINCFGQVCRLVMLASNTRDFLLDSLETNEDNLVNLHCKYLTYR